MSFCRLSEGDVYMVPAEEGIVCYGCELFETEPTVFTSTDGAIEHLLKHCIAGHKAPYDRAIDMATTEKDMQHKITEDMWHRNECFGVMLSTKGAGVNMFMRDGTVFRVNVVKVRGYKA